VVIRIEQYSLRHWLTVLQPAPTKQPKDPAAGGLGYNIIDETEQIPELQLDSFLFQHCFSPGATRF
jgi:hypothetical protein